ncbi:hypothetical protein VN97_g2073 [Penicillium thymicola]|uniref:Uncharacterized protein n=1 Tax=Penicillium thymicola TaxID=293382 RepID=A0AAI9TQE1_PENTH|nr:hypothetical protein VN97_g2073 [Penicillium thymicola]
MELIGNLGWNLRDVLRLDCSWGYIHEVEGQLSVCAECLCFVLGFGICSGIDEARGSEVARGPVSVDRVGGSDVMWQVVTGVILTRIKGIIGFRNLRDVIVTSVVGCWDDGCSGAGCQEARLT